MFNCFLSVFVSVQVSDAYVNVLSIIVFFSLNSLVMIKVNIFLLHVKCELAPGSVHLCTLVLCMAETRERCDIFTALF